MVNPAMPYPRRILLPVFSGRGQPGGACRSLGGGGAGELLRNYQPLQQNNGFFLESIKFLLIS